jgi:Domain of unknown function (DUF4145)
MRDSRISRLRRSSELRVSRRPVEVQMPKKQRHTSEHIARLLRELGSQTDRGVAIISAAWLEEIIELIILGRFIELPEDRRKALFDRMGAPLSSFSAKIEISFAIGAISNDVRTALHLVREIRNKFAHSLEVLSFDHADIAPILEAVPFSFMKTKSGPPLGKFILLFQAMAMALYHVVDADIRLKPIEETHKSVFAGMVADPASAMFKGSEPREPKAD